MDEEGIVPVESGPQSDSEGSTASEAVEVVYTDQLQAVQEYQQLQIGLQCIMIGVLLAFVVFNILKRFL